MDRFPLLNILHLGRVLFLQVFGFSGSLHLDLARWLEHAPPVTHQAGASLCYAIVGHVLRQIIQRPPSFRVGPG